MSLNLLSSVLTTSLAILSRTRPRTTCLLVHVPEGLEPQYFGGLFLSFF